MATKVQIPSVQLDLVREDLGDATRATILSSSSEPFALSDGETLTVDVDNGGVQTVTFYGVNFDDIANATAQEVADTINAATGLTGATAEDDGGKVRITSDTWGASSEIEVTGGTAAGEIGFGSFVSGVGDVLQKVVGPFIVRLNDAEGLFTPGMVGQSITLAGWDYGPYNGTFTVATYYDSNNIEMNNPGLPSPLPGPISSGGTWVVGTPAAAVNGSDFTPAVELINRIPEDSEVEVPLDALLELEIHDGDGTAPAATGVRVYVDGTLAFNGTGFETGFDGPSSATSNPDAATLRIVIDPTTDFTSDVDVDVRVTESGSSLDETYTFHTEDVVSPRLIAADPQSQLVVRLTFNEPVLMSSPTGSTDALNPSNYSFQRLASPTVSVVADEVAIVDSVTVDVSVDIELSYAAPYLVTVSNVVDLFGNTISAPYNSLEFTTLERPWPAGRRWELLDFIPQINKTEDTTGELEAWILCLQDVSDLLLRQIDDWTDIIDPDLAPAAFVDAMLDDMGNPFAFASELSTIDRRRLLRVLIDIYKEKGTEAGIIDVVRFFLGLDVTLEYYNGLGWELAHADSPTLDGQSPPAGPGDELSSDTTEPADAAELGPGERRLLYSFEVHSPINLTDAQRDRIVDIVELMKPAHTHLIRIVEPATEPEPIDHLELGLSELGGASAPGNWTLH